MALSGGLTTANIMPGSGNVIGGQTVYVKLRGKTIEAMRITDPKNLGGLKMANGENPKGYGRKGQAPFTRMKVASLQREQFIKAREYQQKWMKYRAALKKSDKGEKAEKVDKPELDINMEPLVEVLEKRRTVHFHCHRADDLLTALRIAEEFGFEIVLQHGTEGYRVVDELVKKKIPVSLTLVDSPGGKAEVMALIEEAGAILDKAGVLVAINTDDFDHQVALSAQDRLHRHSRRHVGTGSAESIDDQSRQDDASRSSGRLPGTRQRCRFRDSLRLAVQRLHLSIGDLYRWRPCVRSIPESRLELSSGRIRSAETEFVAEYSGLAQAVSTREDSRITQEPRGQAK